ncbi:MAG: hypothetical protein LUD51_02375 [Clostridia bacterium]|nr:hypothetical protein [Clostridia bacterium]
MSYVIRLYSNESAFCSGRPYGRGSSSSSGASLIRSGAASGRFFDIADADCDDKRASTGTKTYVVYYFRSAEDMKAGRIASSGKTNGTRSSVISGAQRSTKSSFSQYKCFVIQEEKEPYVIRYYAQERDFINCSPTRTERCNDTKARAYRTGQDRLRSGAYRCFDVVTESNARSSSYGSESFIIRYFKTMQDYRYYRYASSDSVRSNRSSAVRQAETRIKSGQFVYYTIESIT